MTDWLIRWLGGVPAAEARILAQSEREKGHENAAMEWRTALARLEGAERTADLKARAEVVGDLARLEALLDREKAARLALWSSYRFDRSPAPGEQFRLFCAQLGQTGQGFITPMDSKATNLRSEYGVPGDMRVVSIGADVEGHPWICEALIANAVVCLDNAQIRTIVAPLRQITSFGGYPLPIMWESVVAQPLVIDGEGLRSAFRSPTIATLLVGNGPRGLLDAPPGSHATIRLTLHCEQLPEVP